MAISTMTNQAEQNKLDDALDDTFPASDPPSQTDSTHGIRTLGVTHDDKAIRQRAYAIRKDAGSPTGMHGEHWAQAMRELDAEDAG